MARPAELGRRLRTPAFRRLLPIAIAAAALAAAPAARAEGPNSVEALAGCTAHTLPANDDSSTGAVPIGFTFDFFGTQYSDLYVNNNGNVTFGSSLGEYTPYDFTTGGDPIIAPYLADVDTRAQGSGDDPYDPYDPNPPTSQPPDPATASLQVTYGQTTRGGHPAFCVNWVQVGYYARHTDKRNSFQLIIVDLGGGHAQLVMNYDKVQWETGDASGGQDGLGGTSAAMGFANGDGDPAHYFMQPGSFTNGAFLDSNPSTGLTHNSRQAPAQDGRYVFDVSGNAVSGPRLTGTVHRSSGGIAAGAPVDICPTGGGACVSRNTNSSGRYTATGLNGTYSLTAHAGPGQNDSDGHAGPVTINSADASQDVTLGPAPGAPPPDTTIDTDRTTDDGVPVAYWNDPMVLKTEGCTGGTAGYEFRVEGALVSSGAMTEGPAGHYSASIPAAYPHHGDGGVHIHITCPNSADDENTDFGVYIDPSGVVKNTNGVPVEGAAVTLYRSSSADGPFFQVPAGSAVMSPDNRANPSTTGVDGVFGWDVVAGYYKVRAEKDGCVDAVNHSQHYVESAVLTIPPPVTNLDLRLNCGETPSTDDSSKSPQGDTPNPIQTPIVQSQQVDNVFKAGAAKSGKNGTGVLTLTVPGPGQIVVTQAGQSGKKLPGGENAKAKKAAKKPAVVRKSTKKVTKAGKVSITVKPTAAGVKQLKRKHQLKVKLAVTYTPTGGASRTLIVPVTLKLKKHK